MTSMVVQKNCQVTYRYGNTPIMMAYWPFNYARRYICTP